MSSGPNFVQVSLKAAAITLFPLSTHQLNFLTHLSNLFDLINNVLIILSLIYLVVFLPHNKEIVLILHIE